MDPGREISVGRAAEVGASGVVWPWWQQAWLLQRVGMTSVGSKTADLVTNPVMACHHVASGHAEARMATFGVQHGITAWAELVVGIDGYAQTDLQLYDELGWVEGQPQYLRRDTRQKTIGAWEAFGVEVGTFPSRAGVKLPPELCLVQPCRNMFLLNITQDVRV